MKVQRSLRIPQNVHAALVKKSGASFSATIGNLAKDYIEGHKPLAILGQSRMTSLLIEHDDMMRLEELAESVGISTNELIVRIATEEVEKDLQRAPVPAQILRSRSDH